MKRYCAACGTDLGEDFVHDDATGNDYCENVECVLGGLNEDDVLQALLKLSGMKRQSASIVDRRSA